MLELSDGTKAIFGELKAAATQSRLRTYDELADEAGGINPRSIGAHLTVIHARLRDRSARLPWLVALAVDAETRLPPCNGVFRGEGLILKVSDPSHKAWWESVVTDVFAADWSQVEL